MASVCCPQIPIIKPLCFRTMKLVIVVLLSSLISSSSTSSPPTVRTCEAIKIEMCKGFGYNVTSMPNLVGHELQQDAELQFQTFMPLIQFNCATQLRFFLCSVYVPMCTEKINQNIGPCRPLCENVKSRCHPVLLDFGFVWPPALNCSKFPPENNHKHMCMDGPEPAEHEKVRPANSNKHWNAGGRNRNKWKPNYNSPGDVKVNRGGVRLPKPSKIPHLVSYRISNPRKSKTQLCSDYKFSSFYHYINRTERCAQNCSANILFNQENKNFADIWILLWTVACFVSSALAILTYCLDSKSFKYPEKAIICVGGCYGAVAIAYMVRLYAGREVASCQIDSQHNASILIQEGLDNVWCTIIFVLLYFFGMASLIWWVVVSLCWYLTHTEKWTPERIQDKSTYFHLGAWGLPSLKTMAILVIRVVDADELTGTCYVGNQKQWTLLSFVILPNAIYMMLGLIFLLLGLHAWYQQSPKKPAQGFRMRHGSHHSSSSSHTSHPHLLNQNSNCYSAKLTDSTVLLSLKIALFAFFSVIPPIVVLGVNLYEYVFRDSWYLSGSMDTPSLQPFILKIFMSLVIGVIVGLWVCSSKEPLLMCKNVGRRLKKQPLPSYLVANSVPQNRQLITINKHKRLNHRGEAIL